METTSFWTDEKHFHFLDTIEASFVRTMLHRYTVPTHHLPLRLDRYLPDTSESTLDSKPYRKPKKHAPSDSTSTRARMGGRRTKRRLSELQNSSPEQTVAESENGRESAACAIGGCDKEQINDV